MFYTYCKKALYCWILINYLTHSFMDPTWSLGSYLLGPRLVLGPLSEQYLQTVWTVGGGRKAVTLHTKTDTLPQYTRQKCTTCWNFVENRNENVLLLTLFKVVTRRMALQCIVQYCLEIIMQKLEHGKPTRFLQDPVAIQFFFALKKISSICPQRSLI